MSGVEVSNGANSSECSLSGAKLTHPAEPRSRSRRVHYSPTGPMAGAGSSKKSTLSVKLTPRRLHDARAGASSAPPLSVVSEAKDETESVRSSTSTVMSSALNVSVFAEPGQCNGELRRNLIGKLITYQNGKISKDGRPIFSEHAPIRFKAREFLFKIALSKRFPDGAVAILCKIVDDTLLRKKSFFSLNQSKLKDIVTSTLTESIIDHMKSNRKSARSSRKAKSAQLRNILPGLVSQVKRDHPKAVSDSGVFFIWNICEFLNKLAESSLSDHHLTWGIIAFLEVEAGVYGVRESERINFTSKDLSTPQLKQDHTMCYHMGEHGLPKIECNTDSRLLLASYNSVGEIQSKFARASITEKVASHLRYHQLEHSPENILKAYWETGTRFYHPMKPADREAIFLVMSANRLAEYHMNESYESELFTDGVDATDQIIFSLYSQIQSEFERESGVPVLLDDFIAPDSPVADAASVAPTARSLMHSGVSEELTRLKSQVAKMRTDCATQSSKIQELTAELNLNTDAARNASAICLNRFSIAYLQWTDRIYKRYLADYHIPAEGRKLPRFVNNKSYNHAEGLARDLAYRLYCFMGDYITNLPGHIHHAYYLTCPDYEKKMYSALESAFADSGAGRMIKLGIEGDIETKQSLNIFDEVKRASVLASLPRTVDGMIGQSISQAIVRSFYEMIGFIIDRFTEGSKSAIDQYEDAKDNFIRAIFQPLIGELVSSTPMQSEQASKLEIECKIRMAMRYAIFKLIECASQLMSALREGGQLGLFEVSYPGLSTHFDEHCQFLSEINQLLIMFSNMMELLMDIAGNSKIKIGATELTMNIGRLTGGPTRVFQNVLKSSLTAPLKRNVAKSQFTSVFEDQIGRVYLKSDESFGLCFGDAKTVVINGSNPVRVKKVTTNGRHADNSALYLFEYLTNTAYANLIELYQAFNFLTEPRAAVELMNTKASQLKLEVPSLFYLGKWGAFDIPPYEEALRRSRMEEAESRARAPQINAGAGSQSWSRGSSRSMHGCVLNGESSSSSSGRLHNATPIVDMDLFTMTDQFQRQEEQLLALGRQ